MALILLFEDEKVLRENTKELLEAYGYNCICAENGKECLALVLSTRPDLILCDIMMPFLSGYQIKELLNKHEETKNIPFVFLSAKIESEDKRKGFELGADDYVAKPFIINNLVSSIEKTMAQKKIPPPKQ